MPHYKFDQIAFNITDKKMPEPGDEKMYIGLEHLDTGSLKITRWGSEVELKGQKLVMKKGDVLFGRRNTYLRRAALAPHDGIFSAHGMIFRPKTDVIDPDYFPFFISSNYFMDAAIRISVGSLSPTVNWKTLKELEFDIPTLEEQRKNAMLLKAINETKEAYQELLVQTDNLVKSQFIEMFGDPIDNEKKWPFELLPDVTTIVLGSTPKTKNEEYWNGNIKWISPAELTDNSFYVYDTVKHITEAGVKSAGLKSFPANTVLFSTRAPIGKTAIAGCEMYCNQGFKNFICSSRLNPVYLYYLLKMKKEYFQGLGSGTTFRELSRAAIEKISIAVPDIALQNRFELLFKQSDKSKFELKEAIKSCDALMKSILYTNLEEKEE